MLVRSFVGSLIRSVYLLALTSLTIMSARLAAAAAAAVPKVVPVGKEQIDGPVNDTTSGIYSLQWIERIISE